MSQKFQANLHHRDDVSLIKLAGVIDEDNELADLVEKIPGQTVVIDLGEVERINSCGVRDWVNWLGSIEAKGAEVVLVECSPAIVAQINLVNNFTGNGVVKSFYVPYFCPECDEEKVLLSETADMGPPPHEPPTCRCDECDLVMDFDDMPDSYFAFLGAQKKTTTSDKVDAILTEIQPSDAEKSKIRSRAGGSSLTGPSLSGQSLPSVPSLPSISRGGTGVGATSGSRPGISSTASAGTGSRSGFGSSAGTGSAIRTEEGAGMVVYVLVGVLVLAIGVLAFLILSTQ